MSAKATKGPYKITRGEIWSADECLGVVYRTEAWTSGEKVRTNDQATAALLAASWSMAEALKAIKAAYGHPAVTREVVAEREAAHRLVDAALRLTKGN